MSHHADHVEVMRSFGLSDEDLAAWREGELPDDAFDDWLTDRVARRPAGTRARRVYGAEDVHDFVRRAILDVLARAAGLIGAKVHSDRGGQLLTAAV